MGFPQQVASAPPISNYYYGRNSYQPNNQIIPNIHNISPKIMNLRGSQFNPYPQYLKKIMLNKNKKNLNLINEENPVEENNEEESQNKTHKLTKELEKQIQELRKITKEAKEVFISLYIFTAYRFFIQQKILESIIQ